MKDGSFFHLALLRHQNIKTSLNVLEENHRARPFFALFSSVREKLQFTVSLNHPVTNQRLKVKKVFSLSEGSREWTRKDDKQQRWLSWGIMGGGGSDDVNKLPIICGGDGGVPSLEVWEDSAVCGLWLHFACRTPTCPYYHTTSDDVISVFEMHVVTRLLWPDLTFTSAWGGVG